MLCGLIWNSVYQDFCNGPLIWLFHPGYITPVYSILHIYSVASEHSLMAPTQHICVISEAVTASVKMGLVKKITVCINMLLKQR